MHNPLQNVRPGQRVQRRSAHAENLHRDATRAWTMSRLNWGVRGPKAGGARGVFPVTVEKTGGSDGTKTTAATWTYTVKSLNGETTLEEDVVVTRPRPFGKMTFQTDGPAYGLAFYDSDGELILWDAGEFPTSSAGC